MTELTGKVGFASPALIKKKFSKRRSAIELAATVALAVSLVIAATAVSIGMAHAQALGTVSDNNGANLALVLFVGLLMASLGGLTAVAAPERRASRNRAARAAADAQRRTGLPAAD